MIYTNYSAQNWYETKAYQLQYSFSPRSLPAPVSHFNLINSEKWFRSIPGNPYKR